MPLIAATSASAADADTWDRVAQCESGGMWSSNQGNGFYGGLQMTQAMWEQNGGTAFAPRPDLATRAQQITVADRIAMDADQGPGIWHSCATKTGLSRSDQKPVVDPGGTATPAPEPTREHKPEGKPEREPEHTTEPTRGTTPTSPATPTPGQPAPDASKSPSPTDSAKLPSDPATGTPGTGKHRKDPSTDPSSSPTNIPTLPAGTPSSTPSGATGTTPAPSGTPSGAPSADDTGASADTGTGTGTGKHRADTPRSDDETQRPSRGDARTDLPAANDYTVRPGDNLSVIAEQHSVKGGWQTLYQKNEKVVGSDPDLIHPGQRLVVRQ